MFTTGNILFFVACLFLILFFRRLDRKRLQLSTIKKYSEGIITDYKEITNEKKREFKDATIELNLLMQMAQRTQKNTENVLANIHKLLDEINDRKEEFAELAANAAETKESAEEIRRINKAILKDEEGIRKLMSTIEGSRASLADIEKRIPALEKNFHTRIEDKIASWVKNIEGQEFARMEKHLENARLGLTNELKAACHKAEESFMNTIGGIDKRLAGYDEGLGHTLRKYQDAFAASIEKNAQTKKDLLAAEYKTHEERIQKAANQALTALTTSANGASKQAEQKLQQAMADVLKIKKEFEQNAVQTSRLIQQTLAALQTRADTFKAQSEQNTKQTLAALQGNADSLKAQSEQNTKQTLAALQGNADSLKAQSEQNSRQMLERIHNTVAAHEGRIRELLGTVQGEFTDKINKGRSELSRVEDRVKRANLIVEQFEANIEKKRVELKNKMEKDCDQTRSELAKFEKTLSATNEKTLLEAKNSIGALQAEIKEIDKRIKAFSKDAAIFDRAERMQENLEKNIQTLHAQLENCAHEKKAVAELEKRISIIQSERTAAEGLLGKLGERKKELQAIENRAAAVTGEIGLIEEALHKHKPLFESNQNLLHTMQNELAAIAEGMQQSENLRSRLDELSEKEDEVQRLLDGISGDRESLVTLENRIAALGSAVYKLEQDLSSQRQSLEKQGGEMDQKFREFHNQNGILDRADKLSSRLEKELTAYDKRIGEIRKEHTRLEDLSQKLTAALKGEESLRAMIANVDKKRDELSLVDERVKRANLAVGQFEALIEKKRVELKSKMEKDCDQTRNELAKFEKTFAAAREKALQGTKNSLEELQIKVKETDKRIRAFSKEAAIFDRAERMLERLEKDIQGLHTQLENCAHEKKAVAELEKRISVIQSERAAAESLLEKLSERRKDLQDIENRAAAVTGEIGRIEESLDKHKPLFENNQNLINTMQNELTAIAEEMQQNEDIRSKLDELGEKRDEVQRLLDDISGDKKSLVVLENRIATMGNSVHKLEQDLASQRKNAEKQSNEIEQKFREFHDHNGILARAEELSSRLENELTAYDQSIGEIRKERDHLVSLRQDIAGALKEEKSLRTMIANVDKKREELARAEESMKRVNLAVEQVEALIEKKKTDLENKIEKDNDRTRNEIAKLEKKLTTLREKTIMETKNNLDSFWVEIKEIDKRIKVFSKDSAIFSHADKLSSKLSEDIAVLNSHITQLRIDKKELHSLSKQIEEIRAEEGEVARIANAISDDKKQLMEVERRIKDLSQASQSVEERMQKLSEAGTTVIAPVEAQLRGLSEMQQQVLKGVTELAVKDAKIAQSHNRFKKTEDFANRLEERLGLLKADYDKTEKERTHLMKHVEQMQEKSRKLVENEVRINKLTSSFDQMEGMLADVEKRTTQLTIAQDKLTRMEDSIRDLLLQADVRIEDFSTLSRKLDSLFSNEGTAAGTAKKDAAPPRAAKGKAIAEAPPLAKTEDERNLNTKIYKMYDQGMNANEIARIVKRPVNDIELRLHMRKD